MQYEHWPKVPKGRGKRTSLWQEDAFIDAFNEFAADETRRTGHMAVPGAILQELALSAGRPAITARRELRRLYEHKRKVHEPTD